MMTHEEIEAKRTIHGGWSKKQLTEWGVAWPPRKGWKNRLAGTPLGEKKKRVLDPKFTPNSKFPFHATITSSNGDAYEVIVTETEIEFLRSLDLDEIEEEFAQFSLEVDQLSLET